MKNIVQWKRQLGRIALASFASAAFVHEAAAAAQPARLLRDDQIVQYVLDWSRAEAEAADAAKGRLTSPEAWQFAERLTDNHTALERRFGRAGVPTAESDLGEQLLKRTADDAARLRHLSGGTLDQAFLDTEVARHRDVLGALDLVLIPSATAAALKSQLAELRSEVAAQLAQVEHAQALLEAWTPQITTSGP